MLEIFKKLFGLGAAAIGKMADGGKAREAQARINEQEVAGAPASRLRLWRSFLGWALAFSFIWEIIARPIIATYFPSISLPPSFLQETVSILLGMLGLGF